MEYKNTNREKKLVAKKKKFWCMCCDAQLVTESVKCPNCSYINGSKRCKTGLRKGA